MIFTLIVRTNHLNHSHSALSFARSLIAQQHNINCIYFLFDGTYIASNVIDLPSDEPNISHAWSLFAQQNNIDLSVCAASSYRRGVIAESLAPGFELGSMGQLVESCDLADRVVSL